MKKKELVGSHYLLLSLLFFAGLELLVMFSYWVILLAIILILIVAAGVVLVRVEEQHAFNPSQIILPMLAAVGLIGFTLFLPQTPLIHLYFLLASLIFFWLLRHGTRQAYPTWNWTLTMVVIFLNLAVIFGLRYHLYIALVWILGLVFGVILLASLQSLHRVTKDWVETWLPSLGLAVAVTQLGWVMQFWPLHYVVQAGVAVVAYYVVFNLLSISFERKLSRADMIEYGAVGGLGLIILLFTANWF
jgi:hypothetical protein